jgi:hypothetical protein
VRHSKLDFGSDGNGDGLAARHQTAIHGRPIHGARGASATTIRQHDHAVLEPQISVHSAEQTGIL